MIKRTPIAGGSFYSAKPNILTDQIEQSFLSKLGPSSLPKVDPKNEGKIKAIIVPHAGYMYSGPVAACAYSRLAQDHTPENILLIGPNHSGYGKEISLFPNGVWQTPLGEVRVDNSWLSGDLKNLVVEDEIAHKFEHSLEVQLPFLQYLYKDSFKISAITIRNQSLNIIKMLAKAILKTNFPLIVATSDLSHYEPADIALKKDAYVINALEKKDADALYNEIAEKNISACGPGPASVVAILAKALNWNIEILCYKTSGDVSNDNISVVGYMSAIAEA